MNEQLSQALPAGAVIGDYVVERGLDHDGQNYRYRALHPRHGRCLLHEPMPMDLARRGEDGIHPVDAGDRGALRWLMRSHLERARQFARIRHPAWLTIVDVFESGGGVYHAAEAPAGITLHSLFARHATLDEPQLQALLRPLLDALAAVHDAGLIHRALGPQHIWLQDDGSARLGGFGGVRAPIRFRSQTVCSAALAPYAPPEEGRVDAAATPATDVYALAALLYQLISGTAPPSAGQRLQGAPLPPLQTLAADRCRESTLAAIDGALALDAAQRPQSIDQWRRALRAPAAPGRVVASSEVVRSGGRMRWMLAGLPLLLAVAAAGFWVLAPQSAPVQRQAAAPAAVQTAPTIPATAANRPRFQPVALTVDAGAPQLDAQAITRLSAETEDEAAEPPPHNPPGDTLPGNGTTPLAAATAPPPAATPPARPTATPPPSMPVRSEPAAVAIAPTQEPRPAPPTEPPRSGPAGLEVASLSPPAPAAPDAEALARAVEEERLRAHAQQLALERSRCRRHVSELFASRDFTYADIAAFEDVVKLDDGRLQTPQLRTDDGRRVSFLIDRNGCVVRVLR